MQVYCLSHIEASDLCRFNYMTKHYVAYTQDDIKEQHAHASPVNKLVPVEHGVVKTKQAQHTLRLQESSTK
jgi:hypothetical protein